MLLSIVGVTQAFHQKRRIQCVCLGTVFNLPMSANSALKPFNMAVLKGGTEQARRLYAAVDPEHRLVARELERRWD